MVFISWVVKVRWHPSAFDLAVCTAGEFEYKLLPQVGLRDCTVHNVAKHVGVALDDSIGSGDDRFAVRSDTDVYFAVPDDMEDSSKLGSIGALAGSVQGSANIVLAVFGDVGSPPAPGENG